MLAPLLLLSIVPRVIPPAKLMSASDLAALNGAWIVTMSGTPSSSNCQKPEKFAEGLTLMWLVSAMPSGEVTVSVQGQTNYPSLSGTYTRDGLVVDGVVSDWDGWIYPMSYVNLQPQKDGTLAGFRRLLSVETSPGNPGIMLPCFIDSAVTAKKQ